MLAGGQLDVMAQSSSAAAKSKSAAGTSSASAQTAAASGLAASSVKTSALTTDPVPGIIQKVSPSVVGIIGEAAESDSDQAASEYYGSDTSDTSMESAENLAHGTGVIIRADGWIVTNAHVVNGILDPTVVTSTGKTYTIDKSYIDTVSDLALIHIKAAGLKPAALAPAGTVTQVGEKVVALGTPVSFTLRGSATEGIISGVNRAVSAAYRLIQTDAAINPGNSGGPLLNMKGEVIGINSLKYEAVGVENLGFSIPYDTVRYVIQQLFAYGEVHRPALGVTLEEGWSAEIGLPSDDPLTVVSVDSAAARKAGIQAGDKIYRVNTTAVTSIVDLNELLKKYKPGQTVSLWMQSGGDIVKRSLVLSLDDSSAAASD
ncbi:S1C family serine protease [Paenibacillus pinistramenti]|uniref:S1C family serine protease n=1 Tax=Paenibacillus pinistramenti TaxID=1768003 RepID=UPI003B82DBF7